jgi:CheY-like chemotaxis protein
MPHLLLIDDSASESELIARAWTDQKLPETLHAVTTVEAALAAMEQAWGGGPAALPRLILVDLKLGHASGLDVIQRLRRDPRFACVPIVVMTTSDDAHDIRAAYAAGANGYVTKPATYEQLLALTNDLERFWIRWNRVVPTC